METSSPNITEKQSDLGAPPWWVKELRQYGIAALVMGICMLALKTIYEDQKEERRLRDEKVSAITEKVSSVVDKNSAIISEFKVSVDRNTDATRQLESTIRTPTR